MNITVIGKIQSRSRTLIYAGQDHLPKILKRCEPYAAFVDNNNTKNGRIAFNIRIPDPFLIALYDWCNETGIDIKTAVSGEPYVP